MDQDYEHIRPLKGDFNYGNRYILDALEANDDQLAESALETLNTSKSALDLGSGSGMSTVALADLMPKLERVTTVDMYSYLSDTVLQTLKQRGVDVTHNITTIQNYLDAIAEGLSFPVIMARAVRKSGLIEKHYIKLTEILPPKGVLLSLGDTRLPETTLLTAGMKAVARTGISETVWIKP